MACDDRGDEMNCPVCLRRGRQLTVYRMNRVKIPVWRCDNDECEVRTYEAKEVNTD